MASKKSIFALAFKASTAYGCSPSINALIALNSSFVPSGVNAKYPSIFNSVVRKAYPTVTPRQSKNKNPSINGFFLLYFNC